jgi:hypothetical protein
MPETLRKSGDYHTPAPLPPAVAISEQIPNPCPLRPADLQRHDRDVSRKEARMSAVRAGAWLLTGALAVVSGSAPAAPEVAEAAAMVRATWRQLETRVAREAGAVVVDAITRCAAPGLH